MRSRTAKGFTLIELMVVIVIVGILSAIAIPKFQDITDSAKQTACRSNLRLVAGALNMYAAENNQYPGAFQGHSWRTLDYIPDYIHPELTCPESGKSYRFRITGRNYDLFRIRGWNAACRRNHGQYKNSVYYP